MPPELTPSTTAALADAEALRRDALAGRLFGASIQTFELLSVYLGERLGIYRALATDGPATARDVALRAGIHERYAREWLEQQAVAGLVDVVASPDGDAASRRYALSPGHADVLLNERSLSYAAPLGRFAAALSQAVPALLDAYRLGHGVSWQAYGADAREAQAAFNRPMFFTQLPTEWLPAIPEVHARLQASPPARVADIGCGVGWSTIAIAQAYPQARVDGFDVDKPSIETARANAAAAGVVDRVTFYARDARETALVGQYDFITAFECIHDLARPVGVLATARLRLAAGGTLLVVDERVAERFTAPGDDLERLFYGFSILCCLPTVMTEQPTAATGTVMRPDTLHRYATEAGFSAMEILPIEHDLFRFYLLRP